MKFFFLDRVVVDRLIALHLRQVHEGYQSEPDRCCHKVWRQGAKDAGRCKRQASDSWVAPDGTILPYCSQHNLENDLRKRDRAIAKLYLLGWEPDS